MNKNYRILCIAFIFTIGCSACKLNLKSILHEIFLEEPITDQWRCNFSKGRVAEDSFIGIWQTDFQANGYKTDTLVLAEDGRYYQSYINHNTDYTFTSEWQSWWIETRESGGYYIHFDRMKYCGGVSETCIDPGDKNLSFYDYCEAKWVNMNNEFILSVDWDKSVPGEIQLRHMKPPGYETYFVNYIKIK